MSIEQIIPWCLTIFFGFTTIFFSVKALNRSEKSEIKEDTHNMSKVMIKLDFIGDDIKEIKNDNKSMRSDMNEFRERLAENEASIKSFHKRIDKLESVCQKMHGSVTT